jgi:hypothetical protein
MTEETISELVLEEKEDKATEALHDALMSVVTGGHDINHYILCFGCEFARALCDAHPKERQEALDEFYYRLRKYDLVKDDE